MTSTLDSRLTAHQEAAFDRYANIPANNLDADPTLSADASTWLGAVLERLADAG